MLLRVMIAVLVGVAYGDTVADPGDARDTDLARAIDVVFEATGVDVSDAKVKWDASGVFTAVRFSLDEPQRSYSVNADRWILVSAVDLYAPERQTRVTEEQALESVKELTQRVLGDMAAGIDTWEWRRPFESGHGQVAGTGRLVGDPPRKGLTPDVLATVRQDGAITTWGTTCPPEGASPRQPVVTLEQALATAREHLEDETLVLASPDDCPLVQWYDRFDYVLRLASPSASQEGVIAPGTAVVCVDAVSGEVVSEGITTSLRPAGAAGGGWARWASTLGIPAVGLLLVAGLVWLRHLRRNGRSE